MKIDGMSGYISTYPITDEVKYEEDFIGRIWLSDPMAEKIKQALSEKRSVYLTLSNDTFSVEIWSKLYIIEKGSPNDIIDWINTNRRTKGYR